MTAGPAAAGNRALRCAFLTMDSEGWAIDADLGAELLRAPMYLRMHPEAPERFAAAFDGYVRARNAA